MSVRVAILGTGVMGADHARIMATEVPGAVLQLVCDASEQRARRVAATCGITDVMTDPFSAILRQDVDAVLIASPDQTHVELTLAAIAAGKPVLCEKPLATAAVDCLRVIEAETRAGRRFVQLGFMRRFDPAYAAMKAALEEGLIGRAIMMHNFHRNVEAPSGFMGPMAITNAAPHEFDAARFVLGTEYAAITVFQPTGIDVTRAGAPVFIVLETTDGQIVNIEVNNNAAYGYDVRGELVGTAGAVHLEAPVHLRLDAGLQSIRRYPPDWRPRFSDAYRLQNKAWVDAVRSGTPSPLAATAWDGYCAALVAETGVRALSEGRRITLEMAEKPCFYMLK